MQPQQTPFTDPNAVQPDYGFIVNPEQAAPKKQLLPKGGSLLTKLLLIGGAVLLVLIVGLTIRSVTSKPSSSAYFVSIAQDQQAILHVASAAVLEQNISVNTDNSANTITATMGTSATNTGAYLKKLGSKADPASLSGKISTATDTQLANAVSAGTYDATYQSVMKDLLNTYIKDLQKAYKQSPGPNGQKLLDNEYNNAKLLLTQLDY